MEKKLGSAAAALAAAASCAPASTAAALCAPASTAASAATSPRHGHQRPFLCCCRPFVDLGIDNIARASGLGLPRARLQFIFQYLLQKLWDSGWQNCSYISSIYRIFVLSRR
jgi:hypothetical protein